MKTTSFVALCAEYDKQKKAVDRALRVRDSFCHKAAVSSGVRRKVWEGCATVTNVVVQWRRNRLDEIAFARLQYWGQKLAKGRAK